MIVYMRYVGDKVCLTQSNGLFVFCGREELTSKEIEHCDNGGGDIVIDSVNCCLDWR